MGVSLSGLSFFWQARPRFRRDRHESCPRALAGLLTQYHLAMSFMKHLAILSQHLHLPGPDETQCLPLRCNIIRVPLLRHHTCSNSECCSYSLGARNKHDACL